MAFLDHVISREVIDLDLKKIEVFVPWKPPKDVTEVRSKCYI